MNAWVSDWSADHYDSNTTTDTLAADAASDIKIDFVATSQFNVAYQEFWSLVMGTNNAELFLEDSLW